MMNGMAFRFLSLSSLSLSLFLFSLPLCFILSSSFPPPPPPLTPLGISEWRVAVMCFRLKLTYLLCPWPNQVICLLLSVLAWWVPVSQLNEIHST